LDVTGKTIMIVDKQMLNSTKININTTTFAKGLYLVKIQTADKTYNEKISIVK
jgi:hypothetical protein